MKSFFDLSDKLNEDIDAYSPQALGRKRNTMLRALTLDDSEFERWVHDRIIRFAEKNRIPLQQLELGAFKNGFSEWQNQLQQGDKNYGNVKGEVSKYVSRFMSVAPGIIARFQSGESAPVKEPMSPTMMKFEGDGEGQGAQPAEGELAAEDVPPAEQQYAVAPEISGSEELEGLQKNTMSMIDIMSDPSINMGEDEIRANKAAFKSYVRGIGDQIAQANNVSPDEINYEMVDTFVSSMRQNIETNLSPDMLDIPPEDLDMWEANVKKEFQESFPSVRLPQAEADERAELIAQQKLTDAAMDPKSIAKIYAQDAELGLIHAIERLTGGQHLSDASRARIDRKTDDVQKKYFDIQAEAMMEKYPFLRDAQFKHVGSGRGKLSNEWEELASKAVSSRTSKTDIIAQLSEGNFVRFDEAQGTFIRCSSREIEEGTGCTNQITFSLKKGPSQLMSARDKETRATLEVALSNLSKMGYDFSDANKLAQTFMEQNGLDEQSAQQRAENAVGAVASIRDLCKSFVEGKTYKGQVSLYQPGGEYRDSADANVRQTQELIDSAGPFLDSINEAITGLSQNFPELLGEMAYIAASGDGKFEEGSREIATHFLSLSNTDPQEGPKIVPITRKTMNRLAQDMTTHVVWKSQSVGHVKKKMKPLITKDMMVMGLEGEELEKAVRQRLDRELPYTFSTVLRMIMNELPDTQMESIGYRTTIKRLLEANVDQVYDTVQGVSDSTKKYVREAFDWGFSNMENITKFFEMEPEVGDIELPDFGKDFGDVFFKKEIQDEAPDLDML